MADALKELQQARAQVEIDRLKAENEILTAVVEAAKKGEFDKADKLKTLLSTSEPKPIEIPDSVETDHQRFLDKWRVAITIILVVALFGVILADILDSAAKANGAGPYISLASGLAGIALGWVFANVSAGVARSGQSGKADHSE